MTIGTLGLMLAASSGIGAFLKALTQSVGTYVRIIIMLIGVVMVGFGIFQVAKNLVSHGKAQTNWFVTFALITVGGVLMLSGGFSTLRTFTNSTQATFNNLANGTNDASGSPGDADSSIEN